MRAFFQKKKNENGSGSSHSAHSINYHYEMILTARGHSRSLTFRYEIAPVPLSGASMLVSDGISF